MSLIDERFTTDPQPNALIRSRYHMGKEPLKHFPSQGLLDSRREEKSDGMIEPLGGASHARCISLALVP